MLSRSSGVHLQREFSLVHNLSSAYLGLRAGKEPEGEEEKRKWLEKKEKRDAAATKHMNAQNDVKVAREKYEKVKIDNLCAGSEEAQNGMLKEISGDNGMITSQIAENNKRIAEYEEARNALRAEGAKGGEGAAAIQEMSDSMGIPRPLPDPKEASKEKSDEDFFTPISLEISSSSDTKEDKQSASSLSVEAAVSYNAGLWSASASFSHSQSEAHAEAMAELANASVKVSFECMRVDIGRPWLRGELFYDTDLVLGPSAPE
jgi:hypothetical protein